MTYEELTAYIIHYLENDKTHNAIMLSGEWGSGKSHYIKNYLIPSLKRGKESRCVVVSLYGMHDVLEISKAIYFELKAKWLTKNYLHRQNSTYLIFEYMLYFAASRLRHSYSKTIAQKCTHPSRFAPSPS